MEKKFPLNKKQQKQTHNNRSKVWTHRSAFTIHFSRRPGLSRRAIL